MILKASTRAPKGLAAHLMNTRDNDHVHVHSVDGFVSQDLHGAMSEVGLMMKGLKSGQPLFSVSLSPPQEHEVGIDVFEAAINEIEQRCGLTGQPRAVVFHEKEGRRHAHAVWSRIDPATMTVKKLPYAYYTCQSFNGLWLPNPYHPPLDQVKLPGIFGSKTHAVITAPTPPELSQYPQLQNGSVSYVQGFKPW